MTSYRDIMIHGYRLVLTCGACPEQYDVYDGDEMVAYFRLRHGTFTVEVPDVGGTLVYEKDTQGDGIFTQEERYSELLAGIEAMQKHYVNQGLYRSYQEDIP